MKAKIVNNLLETINKYFRGTEGHRTDQEFLKLCERIQGEEVNLVFSSGDAFEEIDNNYWLPECCWEEVHKDRTDKW